MIVNEGKLFPIRKQWLTMNNIFYYLHIIDGDVRRYSTIRGCSATRWI